MKRILFAILSFFIIPIVAYADTPINNVNFKIKQDYIEARILPDGDVEVKQLLVYDGSFNGILVGIGFANPNLVESSTNYENNAIYNFDGIKDFKVSAKNAKKISFDDFDSFGFKEFEEVEYAFKGDKYRYTVDYTDESNEYTIYHVTRADSVAFLLEYKLDNIVVMHDDVAELYWQILDLDPDRVEEKDVRVRVYLPYADTKDTFRIWTHDILSSNIDYIEKNGELIGFEVKADEVTTEDQLDVRATFNKNLIPFDYDLDHFEGDGLENILEVEQKRADLANEERAHLKRVYDFYDKASKVLIILMPILFIIIYFVYARKPKTGFYAKYYREFIEDYNVEVIDFLYRKSLTPNALSAAIMNLVYLKKIDVEETLDSKEKKKVYKFKLLSREDLDENNLNLVEFLFDKIGNGEEVTTKDIKKYASSLSTGSKFNASYTKWSNKVKSVGKKQKFFKSKTGAYVIGFIYLISCFLVMTTGTSQGVDNGFMFLSLLASIILFIYICVIKAYNAKGALHVKKWNAFKNFLKDFGTFELKELPEIKLWERYLVYATMFGLAEKVQKVMNVKIKEISETDTSYAGTTFTRLYLYDSLRHTVSHAVSEGRRQYAASRANAYSSSSSGGGFGGGGSFGGGFGGGGGSHGGF